MRTISLKTGHLIEVSGIALGISTLYISNIFELYYLKFFFFQFLGSVSYILLIV